MGLLRELITRHAQERVLKEQQKAQYNAAIGDALGTVIKTSQDPFQVNQAKVLYGDWMGQHGGPRGKELQNSITQWLVNAVPSNTQPQTAGPAAANFVPEAAQPFVSTSPRTLAGGGTDTSGMALAGGGASQQARPQPRGGIRPVMSALAGFFGGGGGQEPPLAPNPALFAPTGMQQIEQRKREATAGGLTPGTPEYSEWVLGGKVTPRAPRAATLPGKPGQVQAVDEQIAALQQKPTRTPAEEQQLKDLQTAREGLLKETGAPKATGRVGQLVEINRILADPNASPADKESATQEKKYLTAQAQSAESLAQTRERQNFTGNDIVPGTAGFQIAQDLAYGKLTFAAFRGMFAYRDAPMRQAIYFKATQLNPKFNEAEFERGYRFASRPQTIQQLSALDNVESGVSDLLRLSDLAERSGAPVLNQFVNPGGYAVGNRHFSNFQTARVAFADELSGALGFGGATDMSRQMGFDMTDPKLSPEAFSDAVQTVVWPFLNRKRESLLSQMGPYGEPERERGKQIGEQQHLNPEGLPLPPTKGARPTPALVKLYVDRYGSEGTAKVLEELRKAGWEAK